MSDLNLKPYDPLYPMRVHPYEELLKDQNASVIDKINSIIDYLNSVGKLTSDVVKNWNTVYNWVMNDGLTTGINNKLEDMLAKGEFDTILNTVVTKIGDIATLTTTDKSNLTKAVNEIVLKMGNLANLTTTDKSSLVNSVNEHTTQLMEKTDDIKQISSPTIYNEAVFTFIDDDGAVDFITKLQPTFDSKAVKSSIAVISSFVGTGGYMTLDQLKTLQSNGYEMLCHSKTHSQGIFRDNLPTESDTALRTEFYDAQQYMITNGLNGYRTIVYPYGGFGSQANRVKQIARDYFDNGLDAAGTYNTVPVDNMYMQRYQLDSSTPIATVQTLIDDAISKKAWLVFFTHSGIVGQIDGAYVGQVIDYVKSKGASILPFGKALKLKGNALSIGEYTDKKSFFVAKNGEILNKRTQFLTDGTIGMAQSLNYYTSDCITIQPINTNVDTLLNIGGNLVTYHSSVGNFSYQTYTPYTLNKLYMRKWIEGTQSWGTWDLVNLVTGNNLDVLKTAVNNMNAPITDYRIDAETIVPLNTVSDTYLNYGGVMRVFRSSVGNFSYATFTKYDVNELHMRKWLEGTQSWGSWSKISV